MSDGERVIFYLIGQCLAVRADSIIILDEPEMHLHKSIQAPLYDELEAVRQDCRFVYLTHDLDFAASRVNAAKVSLRAFDGTRWDWVLLPSLSDLPEEIYLKVVGSRKPVLFTEGTASSNDTVFLSHLYRQFTVQPREGCKQVIHSTVTFNNATNLHRVRAYGLVDRDFRRAEEIEHLKKRGVHVLPVSEFENLFLNEDALRAIAKLLGYDETKASELVSAAKEMVFQEFQDNLDKVLSRMTAIEVESQFKNFNAEALGLPALESTVKELFDGIQVREIYERNRATVERVITERNYPRALEIYPNKGLVPNISSVFIKWNYGEFVTFLQNKLLVPEGKELLSSLQNQLPQIAVQ